MAVQSARVAPPIGLAGPMLALLAAFYVLPVGFTILLSLGHPPSFSINPESLSIAGFERMFSSGYYLRALLNSVVLGAGAGLLAIIMGYPIAYYLARSTSFFRQPLFYLTLIPMAVGQNVITLGWLVILGRNGFANSVLMMSGVIDSPLSLLYTWGSLVIALVNVLFTFMVLPIAAVLKTIDPAIEQAARNLGASPARTFITVTLPLSKEGVAAGFLAVFIQSSTALVMPLLLGGQSTTILPILVWEQFSVANDRNFSAALSVALLVVAAVVLVLQMQVGRRHKAAH